MPRWDQSGTPIATAPTQAPKRWDEQGNPIETAIDNRIAPVSIPKPPLPAGLIGPKAGEENSVGGSGNEPGLPAIVNQGIHQIGRAVPAFANSVSRGTSNLVEGAAKTLSPLALAGAVAAPVATVGALAGSAAASAGGRAVAHRLGASPDTEQAVGDVAGLAGGGLGAKGGSMLQEAIPSTARAGENFQTAMKAAGPNPIDTTEARQIAARATQLGTRGASVPKVVKDFTKATAITPVGSPGEVSYAAGRDFSSNAGKLSAAEAMKTKGDMGRQVTLLARALNDANEGAAESAGVGDQYRAAMKEYRQIQQLKSAGKFAAKKAIPTIAGGGLVYEIAKKYMGL